VGIPSVVLLCALGFANAFSIGAFPVLLPEIGRADGLDDFALGTAAAAFGFARILADIPVGLFVTNHLRRAILIAPGILAAGVLCIAGGGPFPLLVLGRALIGAGHALGTLSSLTAILRHRDERNLSVSLSAFDMSGIVGVLGGMALVGLLPTTWPWHVAFLVACVPQGLGFIVLPSVLASLPADTPGTRKQLFARDQSGGRVVTAVTSRSASAPLAFAAGAAVALSWSAVGQFILPIRADREFGLSRVGVASLLALPQLVDVLCLLPVGIIADRTRRTTALGILLVTFAAGVTLVAFAPLSVVIVGCVLFGVGLAGWILPLNLLRRETPPQRFAWRTAQYRIAIDAGMFLGPFLGGVLGEGNLWMLSAGCGASLLFLGVAILLRRS
jgi:ACS family D-galactonate transporter-like MFS transporter